MRLPLVAEFLSESEFGAWDDLVRDSTQGSIYSTPAYLRALCDATGGTFRILAARRGEELVGGVALYERRVEKRVRISPRLLLFYNGLVLRDFATKYPSQRTARILEVSTALEAKLSGAGYESIVLKNNSSFTDARVFIAQGWVVRPGYSYVVPIADTAAAWNRVEQNLRRLIKRCGNEGVRFTDDDDFESFMRMHTATAQRKDVPLYLPDDKFRRFFATLKAAGLCRLYHARLANGQSISAQLVLLGGHSGSHSVSAASDPAYLQMGATAFLRWKAFESLSALGYATNDLTDAALNPVSHFKSQLGGNLEMCLVLEKAPTADTWRQRIKSSIAALVGHRGGAA
ncbi:MAG: GNAT family N-acetyltransferase [Betaproteobacteria bacterium]